jgi:mRNA-degrading endonuclease RelE of RelBE toxin-antitoxin system
MILPELLRNLPPDREEEIKRSVKDLADPYPGQGRGDKNIIRGSADFAYRLRVGSYRIFYRIEKSEMRVYVFDIITAEQAHKKYGRL